MAYFLTDFRRHGLVCLDIFSGARPLEIKENGFLGRLSPGAVEIDLFVFNLPNLFPYTLNGRGEDGKWKIEMKKVIGEKDFGEMGKAKIFKAAFPIRLGKKSPFVGVSRTLYPQNGFRFVYLKDGGKIEIWALSVVSQMGQFFYWPQMVYDTICYRERNGRVFCPEFADSRWDNFREILGNLFQKTGKVLPPKENYQKPVQQFGSRLSEGQGRVLWYNVSEGIGCVVTWVGPKRVLARVYWRNISKRDLGPIRLIPGETVSFDRIEENHSVRHGSYYKYQLVGVIAP